MAGAVIGTGAVVGECCLVNTQASLDHDGYLSDFASLAPGVTTGGNVTIGPYTAISLGANLIHQIEVGEHTVVGAGAVVLQHIPDYVVAYGNPARVIRNRKKGEKYL